MRVAFVGLGVMGRPMALNLVRAGFAVTVHNRSPEPVQALVAAGATAAATPADAARECDVAITMLPDTPDVERVVFGPDGLAEALRPATMLCDMSTIAPAGAVRIAANLATRGVDALDAPVSGGEAGAIAGTLTIMVGGSADSLERVRPVLAALGASITHIGGPGGGQVAKAANQVMVAANVQGAAEALALARAAGVDPARVREALSGGFAASRVLEVHGQRMIDGAFAPGFRMSLHRKDLGLALELAGSRGMGMPATALVAEAMSELIAEGHGDEDSAALYRAVVPDVG
jgi:2-hydroxy-3-oxopropionate reductase